MCLFFLKYKCKPSPIAYHIGGILGTCYWNELVKRGKLSLLKGVSLITICWKFILNKNIISSNLILCNFWSLCLLVIKLCCIVVKIYYSIYSSILYIFSIYSRKNNNILGRKKLTSFCSFTHSPN